MYKHLYSEITKLTGHRVLCIGDIMLDRFIYGNVSRISPEAPIPVFHEKRMETTLGGSGNVVRNIVSMGGNVDTIFIVGKDQAGYDLTEKLSEMPEVSPYVITDKTRPTIIKTRFVCEGQQMLRSDREDISIIDKKIENQILLSIKGAIEDCDVVILSDYAKGILTDKIISQTIKLGREKNKPVLIDTKGRDFTKYKNAHFLTPNRKELKEATGMEIKTVEDAYKASNLLIEKCELDGVLAKLGKDGLALILKDKPIEHFETKAREVYDVSGAGDTVVATMALAMAGGLSISDSSALANLAGSIVVTKTGTATTTQSELQSEIMKDQSRFSESKIMSTKEITEVAKDCKNKNKKVGFTNGVFDLLHSGHLSSINQAKRNCDFLIVGINSDASVKRLKGDDRPIYSEEERALVLSALSNVDAVVIFNDDTPYDIIKTIKPDVLIKGSDYKVEEVVGYDLVQSWGGKVVLADLIENKSTTNTVEKLKD